MEVNLTVTVTVQQSDKHMHYCIHMRVYTYVVCMIIFLCIRMYVANNTVAT